MSFEEKDLTGDISGLGPFELDALQDWEYKFMEKYVKVGTIKKEVPVTDAESSGEPSESTPRDVDAVKPTAAAVKSDETPSNVEADKE
ncbi:membrane steroid-binding protein 2-like [Trifolium medium]|uniref:Membrane steroid-binding protein 2-like n=1 Tax=Trifolium medium TaxID=97028 RepID=A0A392Q0G5_9FABA|nr:membrane steroid-binding protein 2-like [Trifolium medium]